MYEEPGALIREIVCYQEQMYSEAVNHMESPATNDRADPQQRCWRSISPPGVIGPDPTPTG